MEKKNSNGQNSVATSALFKVEFNGETYEGFFEDLAVPTINIPELNRTFRGFFKRWSEYSPKFYIKDFLTGDQVIFKPELGLPDIYEITVTTEVSKEETDTTHVFKLADTTKYYLDKTMAVQDYDSFKRVYRIYASDSVGGVTKETHEENNIIFRSKRFTFKERIDTGITTKVTVYANWIDDSDEDEAMHKMWVNRKMA